jgi:membrane protein implicated in regulation of membrane protease activity
MFITAYVFALVLGFVLLGASFLMGGDHDGDGDTDVSADADADVDVDHGDVDHADVDHADMDGHADAGHDAHGDVAGLFGVLGSLRFWTFFLAFGGLTGLVLDGLSLTGEYLALGLAIAVGYATGWTAVALLRRLSANDTGVAAGVSDYVGKSGELLISVGPGRIGKIRIELKGTTVDFLALADEEIGKGQEALIVELRGDKAVVASIGAARASARS